MLREFYGFISKDQIRQVLLYLQFTTKQDSINLVLYTTRTTILSKKTSVSTMLLSFLFYLLQLTLKQLTL